MAAAQKTKASDKQAVCKKLVTLLKKRHKGSVPQHDRPVLETILYAICLENASVDEADAAYERLHESFHDLNEIRVSSISELEGVFQKLDDPEWRALRVRTTLQHIFENRFSFDLEDLRRKTLEHAGKQLDEIQELSDFVRLFTLQTTVGGHVIPVDDRMRRAAVWLGLADPQATPAQVSESLKPAVRKADAPRFCYLLRRLATEPGLQKTFQAVDNKAPEDGYDLESAPERLSELFEKADKRSRSKSTPAKTKTKSNAAAKSTSSKKKAGKTASGKKTAGAARKKKTSKGGKKTAAKKSSAGRGGSKKKTAKKKTTKKKGRKSASRR